MQASRDGRWSRFSRSATNADNDLYLWDAEKPDKEPVHLTPHEGNVEHAIQTFTPDSTQLYYASNQGGEYQRCWSHDLKNRRAQGRRRGQMGCDGRAVLVGGALPRCQRQRRRPHGDHGHRPERGQTSPAARISAREHHRRLIRPQREPAGLLRWRRHFAARSVRPRPARRQTSPADHQPQPEDQARGPGRLGSRSLPELRQTRNPVGAIQAPRRLRGQ